MGFSTDTSMEISRAYAMHSSHGAMSNKLHTHTRKMVCTHQVSRKEYTSFLVGIGGEHCCILANAVTPLPRVIALSTIEMSSANQAEHRSNRSLSLLSVAESLPTVALYSLYTAIDSSTAKVMNRVFARPDVL